MRKGILILLGVVFLLSLVVMAAETTKTGILIDARCAARMGGDATKAAAHKTSCSLMPPCQASGYGIVTEGKFFKFDSAGDDKALALIKGSDEALSFKVEVTGDLQGDNLTVKTIKPVN